MVDQTKVIATQVLEDVVNKSSSDRILLRDLVSAMDSVGFGLAIMIFAFGIIIPLPPPFPSIISVPLVIFAIQMICGYNSPKLPKRFFNISVKRSVLATLIQRSSPYIRKVEKFLKPRLPFVFYRGAERVLGFFIFLFASFILLPIPLSNFIPGLGILIISFGLLGKDGLVTILGVIVGLSGIVISVAALFFGVEFFLYIKNFFFS
ncbi:MAG: exopolysaccharide biosynthesis protein [Proteobacteria bacterium]|nr:exopolysaccharide biosynthesis protein [Pseudomonadota bacterium]